MASVAPSIELSVADLFSPPVRVAASALTGTLGDLHPGERRHVARAVASRQREFATGRLRARELLVELGFDGWVLDRDIDRVPVWPTGVIGSISHTQELCVVAVAPVGELAALGVDVERDEPLEPELFTRIATADERAWLAGLPASQRGGLARAIFSVKECVYKAAFPSLRERWGFQDVSVELAPEAQRFEADTPGPAGRVRRTGRLLRRGGFWIVGVAYGAA